MRARRPTLSRVYSRIPWDERMGSTSNSVSSFGARFGRGAATAPGSLGTAAGSSATASRGESPAARTRTKSKERRGMASNGTVRTQRGRAPLGPTAQPRRAFPALELACSARHGRSRFAAAEEAAALDDLADLRRHLALPARVAGLDPPRDVTREDAEALGI